MADTSFMRVRLHGGRFRDAELPFFILGDLAPLHDLVVEMAKWSYKEKRQAGRVPAGFGQTYMKIVGLSKGSSVVEVDIGTTQSILPGFTPPNYEHFEAAIENIVDAIWRAGQGAEHLNGQIPSQYMKYFNRLGRSLLPGETLEITTSGRKRARLTQKTRETLVRHFSGEVVRDITARGVTSKVDAKNMKFRLEQIHGVAIDSPFDPQHKDTLIAALDSYENDKRPIIRVQARMIGRYDKRDRLHVESIKNVEQLHPLDVDARLDEFRNLQDGWVEGGVAPDHAGLDWLSGVFGLYYPDDLPLPRTYPMADGGVSLEWSFGVREADVEIDLDKHTGEWFVFNEETGKGEADEDVDLDCPDGWRQIIDRLRDLKVKM